MPIYSLVLVVAERLQALASWPEALTAKKVQHPIHAENVSLARI